MLNLVKRNNGTLSKTININMLAVIVGGIVTNAPMLKEFVPPESYAWAMIFFNVLNVVLYKHTEARREREANDHQ